MDSPGHRYASFVVPAQVEPLPSTGRVLGVDRGVKGTATTTSDPHDLPHAEYGGKARAARMREGVLGEVDDSGYGTNEESFALVAPMAASAAFLAMVVLATFLCAFARSFRASR